MLSAPNIFYICIHSRYTHIHTQSIHIIHYILHKMVYCSSFILTYFILSFFYFLTNDIIIVAHHNHFIVEWCGRQLWSWFMTFNYSLYFLTFLSLVGIIFPSLETFEIWFDKVLYFFFFWKCNLFCPLKFKYDNYINRVYTIRNSLTSFN